MKTLVRTLAAGLVVASVASASGDQPEGGLLIITTDSFADIVEPLAEWKREKGLFTTVVTTSDINPDTTPSPTEIDNYIELVADSMQAGLSYVLIVGSSRLVLSSDGGEYYTDCPYGDTTSGYPMEMPVGRLPVDDARQCSTLITKTLEYERPAPGADTAWYRKGCTVIREDGDSDDTIYWNDSRIAHGHWKADSFIVIDSLSDSAGHSSSHVTQAARDGRAFITYRGTAVIYWRQPFDSLLADTWRNGHRTPIVVAATCETVELGPYVTWPYGNEFVCAGSSDSLGGAVAYFGTSHTGERIARQRSTCFRGFLHGVYHDGESRIGNATLRARHWVDSLNMGRSRYEEWNLLGDPTMHMWTGGVPRTPQLTWSPDTIYRTTMKLAVTVSVDGTPVTGALVCLRKGNELHVAARTDTSGVAILKPGAHGSGWVMLTVSEGHVPAGNSILPYQDSVYSLGKGGWGEVASMPVWPGPSPRRVYKGGWLAYNEGNGLIYGAKGHKTVDFYSYEPDSNLWSAALRGMPDHTHPVWFRKRPHDGSKGVCDGDNVIYVTQGYNTCGWWAYSISADSWYYLADVPLGDSRKKVKYGTDLAYVPGDTDYVYCLKGYRSEFHRYDISADSWEELDAVPGIYQGPKWDRGSWLVWDG
ncbi:MAG: hypothetical protein JSU73_01020, partial [candidate division WOR-3 bacterium]